MIAGPLLAPSCHRVALAGVAMAGLARTIRNPFSKLPTQGWISHSIVQAQLQMRSFSATTAKLSIPDLDKIRNLAIIAHVDHGKTSLVDQLLRQSGAAEVSDQSRVMDSNDLEKERGITILSKSTAVTYKGHRINIVDTPGHSDFGGEVERVLSMVDGVCLVVCATEGPMTQTKFVLSKAIERGLQPIVVLNKVDRPTARVAEVEDEILELFLSLDVSESQLEYTIMYASAREGWAKNEPTDESSTIHPLLDKIVEVLPSPKVNRSDPFSLLVTQIENDTYVGKCYLGKIQSGVIRVGDSIKSLDVDGKMVMEGKCTKIIQRSGLDMASIQEAGAGDIVSLAGIENTRVNHTICAPQITASLPYVPVDPPTIAMSFYVNDSPLGGKEGTLLTSQVIRERLFKEIETNVSLEVVEMGDAFEVKGRGELQIGVLIETMRREGFELSVSPPRVIYKVEGTGKARVILEPMEEVTIDVDSVHTGTVIEKMNCNKGEMKNYTDSGDRTRLVFDVPTRGLLGYPAEFKNDTRGQGTLNSIFIGYQPYKGPLDKTRKGSIVSTASGETTTYALLGIEPRGKLFVEPGVKVYPGMIVGEHSREIDLEVNPAKAKQLTNVRSAVKDETVKLVTAEKMSLERMISYIQDDEVIEVTPMSLRTRKRELDSNKRKTLKRRGTEFGLPVLDKNE
ncbi:GTP-binding protein TypA/BipA [Batrachochytrium salamandrivorans]|nr:GTP-binding protein TypA/BipA [Batrachochytrium salamandrivorans]